MDSDIIYNIDGDMFPINQISLREFIGDYPIAGVPQSRLNSHYVVNYLWNGLFGFKPNEIKWDLFQWDTHLITDDPKTGKPFPGISTDVGGTMFFYLNEEPEYKKIIHLWSGSWNKETLINNGILIPEVLIKQLEKDPRNLNGFYFSEFYPPGFLHYRAGGNWDGYGNHSERKESLFKGLDEILSI